jgi:hypothetical protein
MLLVSQIFIHTFTFYVVYYAMIILPIIYFTLSQIMHKVLNKISVNFQFYL